MSSRYRKDGCVLHINKYEKFLLDPEFLLERENLGGSRVFLESYCKNWDKIDRENLEID